MTCNLISVSECFVKNEKNENLLVHLEDGPLTNLLNRYDVFKIHVHAN